MKAMVFCAGLGSRLGELTKSTPKPLLDIGGKTILEHVIERLKDVGVTSVMINLFYLADRIEAFARERNNFGVDLHFSRETELLGTGGGLMKAREFFAGEEAFFVHNSDIYCELDLSLLLAEHRRRDALATLAVMRRESSRQLLFDAEMKLCGWQHGPRPANSPTPNVGAALTREPHVERTLIAGAQAKPLQGRSFSGIQLLNAEIFNHVPHQHGNFSIIEIYLNAAQFTGRVFGYVMPKALWIDIGTPAALETLRDRLKAAR